MTEQQVKARILCAEGILDYIEQHPEHAANPHQIRTALEMDKQLFDETVQWMRHAGVYNMQFIQTHD